jgi:plastocyanin
LKPGSILKIGFALMIMSSIGLSVLGCGGGGGDQVAAENLIVQSDSVTGSGCFQTNYAHRGELFVFRIRVVDPVTGEDMDDTLLDTVTVVLPDGQTFDAHYGGHPGGSSPTDYFWATAWEVPLNYPTGQLTYQVEATAADGRTGEYHQFNVGSSVMQIKEYDPAFVARRSVNIQGGLFDPPVVTATQGAAVRWTNKDQVDHQVVGEGFDTGIIAPGERAEIVFDEAGSFDYHCAIHPTETGTVVVEAP